MNRLLLCLMSLAAGALLLTAQPPGPRPAGRAGKGHAPMTAEKARREGDGTSARSRNDVVVLELFTSEGCSSCPPADNLLASMPIAGSVIILGEHVDYWDGLGWKDRFSSPLFSARQQDYGTAMHTANVYTPQVVVNGRQESVGSDSASLSNAIDRARMRPNEAADIQLEWTGDETLKLTIPKLPDTKNRVDVILALTESGLSTEVSRGENAGHNLRHVPVVRSMIRLTELDPALPGEYGVEARLNLRKEWNREKVGVVVLVQDQVDRHILGAVSIRATPATTSETKRTRTK